jgi:hypothetical protein
MGSQSLEISGSSQATKYRKEKGRNLLAHTSQAINCHPRNVGWIVPSGLSIRVATKQAFATIAQARIAPHATQYTVEVIYERAVSLRT